MSNFFEKYPKMQYDFLKNGKYQEVPDIFRQVRPSDIRVNKLLSYEWVNFREERPDQLSQRLYGTPHYHWTFFIVNPKLSTGLHAWPKLHNEFQEYIAREYDYHTLRAYRETTDDIDFNKVDDRAAIGAKMIGLTSGALATVVSRDIQMNTIKFKYDNDRVFHENQFQKDWERIIIMEEKDWYVSGWDEHYTEFNSSDGVSNADFYVRDDLILDEFTRSYDIREGRNALHHWYDNDREYNYNNYENLDFVLTPDSKISFKTNLEWEMDKNDDRAQIAIVRREHIVDFSHQYMKKIKS